LHREYVALPAVRRGPIAIALCAALAVAGCGGSDDSSTGSTKSEASAPVESSGDASNRSKPKVTVPSGAPPKQLEKTDLIEGTGAEAKSGDNVTVQYVGVNYKNGKEFDSSWSRSEPFSFPLGASEVISGWDQGVEGMKVGGQRELIIPPELAYGETGAPPAIPPNETLVFVIDLLAVG
jgi:peptidylprolyl isomerase